MGIIGKAVNTFAALKFLRMLTTKWDKTKAYELGIIDDKGKLIKKPETSEEKNEYTIFHRLVYNIKRLLEKLPFGRSTIARYATALYLIREHTGLSERLLGECLFETLGYNPYEDSTLNESYSILATGEYTLSGEVYLENGQSINMSNQIITIEESISPTDTVFGIPVFRVMCEKIRKPILITTKNIISNEQ